MSAQQVLEETIRLELPATLKYLNVVGACLSEMLAQVEDLEELDTVSYKVQLGVHEICTNIVQHAYAHSPEDKRIFVTMEFAMRTRCLRITLHDSGDAFDQSTVNPPNLDEGQVHGYGLFLAKNLMDEVVYSRHPKGNCWSLVKKL